MIGWWPRGVILSARTTDIAIIGAGAAGMELARLASLAGQKVTLFEQGTPDGRHIYQRIPLMVGKIIGNRRFVDSTQSAPQIAAGNRELPVLTGRGLGGSSRVNGNVAYAGPVQRYDHVFGPLGLSFGPILQTLNHDQCAPRPHSWNDKLSDRFLQAAAQLGSVKVDDPDRAGDFAGGSVLHVNTKRGLRHNHLENYRATAAVPNIEIIRAPAIDIQFDGKRATGVRYKTGATTRTIDAGEVILCAGAIRSPMLLMRSGVGAADRLAAAGLNARHDLPEVGQHLKDHANLRLPFSCAGFDTMNQKTRGLKALCEGMKYIAGSADSILRGPGASAGVNGCDTGDIYQDAYRIQLVHFTQDRSKVSQSGIVFEKQQKASLGIYALWPKSEGSVRITAKGVQIDPGFLMDQADVNTTLSGMARARALIREMGFQADPQDGSDEYVIRKGVYSGYHLIGSNRMSRDADGGVVGPDFAVHGMTGISVCDASVLPDHLSSHSYLPVIAMARMFGQTRGWI